MVPGPQSPAGAEKSRLMNRYRSPRFYSATDLITATVVGMDLVNAGTRWVSAASADEAGEVATGRLVPALMDDRTVTDADRAAVLAIANRAVESLRGSSRSFDTTLYGIASAIVRGSSISVPGALSVAAYLPFWAAKQDDRPASEDGFAGILALFAGAAARLKFPKVTFVALPGIGTLKLQRAASGRNAGGINLTDGRPFGENRFFGAITPTGEFRPGRDVPEALREFLARLASDPATVAGEYGKGSGNCCFCCKDLTDNRSVTVGYGPICAGHYGLPWGE